MTSKECKTYNEEGVVDAKTCPQDGEEAKGAGFSLESCMRPAQLLKIFVVIDWAMLLLAILTFSFNEYLPDPLKDWVEKDLDAEAVLTTGELALKILVVLYLPLWLASTIGILKSDSWGRWLYLSAFIYLTILSPFAEPTVEHAFTTTIGNLRETIMGVILALAFIAVPLEEKLNKEQGNEE